MPNLYTPLPYIALYAFCVDDSLPKFRPDNWVRRYRLYRVKYLCESLNTDGMAITLVDKRGEEIHPSDSMSSFRAERFDIFEIFLN
jgi:hypothetical protein